MVTGGRITSAELGADGRYVGTAGSKLYGLRVSVEEVDWDEWRLEYVCPDCGGIAEKEPMLLVKTCEHCGAHFGRDGVIA